MAVAPEQIAPGQYLKINRKWQAGDKITLNLDFRLRLWEQVPVPHHSTAASAAVCEPCGGAGPSGGPPTPVWSSTADGKWPASGKQLTGAETTPIGEPMQQM